jgi:hypothetical protein
MSPPPTARADSHTKLPSDVANLLTSPLLSSEHNSPSTTDQLTLDAESELSKEQQQNMKIGNSTEPGTLQTSADIGSTSSATELCGEEEEANSEDSDSPVAEIASDCTSPPSPLRQFTSTPKKRQKRRQYIPQTNRG